MSEQDKISKSVLIFLAAIALFSVGFFSGRYINNKINYDIARANQQSLGSGVGGRIYNEALDIIRSQYVEPNLDGQKLEYGSVKGLSESLGDGFTTFYTPEEAVELDKRFANQYKGIGIVLEFNEDLNYTIIQTPIEGYPAQKAGLLSGDAILEIDEESMQGKRPNYLVDKITKNQNNELKIKVYRQSDGSRIEKTIVREQIDNESIRYEDLGDGLFRIEISQFTESSVEEFENQWSTTIEEILAKNPKAVILDLRNNPGGYVSSAISVASSFLPEDTLVMMEEDRDGAREEIYTTKNQKLLNIPLVVLVNGGSASASEIVAAALQDNKRAKIIGTNTYGKGFEQKHVALSDGSILNLVFKKWLSPNGNAINRTNPIKPDIFVESRQSINEEDLQLEEGKKQLISNT